MIRNFADQGTADVYAGHDTKAARKACPVDLWSVAQRKLDYVRKARQLKDLLAPPGNRLEALKGDRKGQHSIRINQQYRICFRWEQDVADDVEIVDYH